MKTIISLILVTFLVSFAIKGDNKEQLASKNIVPVGIVYQELKKPDKKLYTELNELIRLEKELATEIEKKKNKLIDTTYTTDKDSTGIDPVKKKRWLKRVIDKLD